MSSPEAVKYTFGEFQLDSGEPALLRNGKPVTLQLKTLETLIALVKRSGHLVTRDELIEEIWPDAFVDENNLSQHIRTLRKMLEESKGQAAVIETVPRRGYRFLSGAAADGDQKGRLSPGIDHHCTPHRSTRLIGRESEIAELTRLLKQDDVRLLTLTGVGGTGKTTLAQAVSYEIAPFFRDGVCFVQLGSVTNPDLAVAGIAQSLGIKESGTTPVLTVLKNYVRERRMLLVVDNFEQVLPAAPALAELIHTAPGLKILVTSRAVLRLSTDREYMVPPLSVPEASKPPTVAALGDYESVRLFAQRAAEVRPGFALTEDNVGDVAQICTRLDGLPLAIELAAARVKILSPKTILQKLENRLSILTGGATDLPARQRTVRGTVEWSYDLLDDDEKAIYRRLSVFAGGFTFESAESVVREWGRSASSDDARSPAISGDSSSDMLDLLTSLSDKSLVVSREQADGNIRFRMLEVVREYALETLALAGEKDALIRAHAAYFLRLAEAAAEHLQRAESLSWLNLLEEEHDNLRAVLRWSLDDDPETAGRMAAALRFFWLFHTHITEGRRWVNLAYEKSFDLSSGIRAKLLNSLGVGARIQGDYESAEILHTEALAESSAAGDIREVAFSNRGLGAVAARRGNIAAAQQFFERTLELSRELQDVSEVGYSLGSLGTLARIKGDNSNARRMLEESLATFRQLGQTERVITNLYGLGVIGYKEKDMASARELFSEAILLAQSLKDKIHISDLFDGIAAVDIGEDLDKAARLAGAAARLRESIGYELAPAERAFREEYISKIKTGMNEEAFIARCAEGAVLSTDDAIDLAINN
jgi:predicted ATPase/DNA-binding winged helix-turn-helix (wHTH) protein